MNRRLPTVVGHLVVPLFYAAVAVVLLGPGIVTRCGDTIFGGAGDSTAGLIWLEWNYDVLHALPFRGTTPLLSAPVGAPLWQPFYVTSLLLMLPMWATSRVVGPVCSWNVAIISGFVLDGWIMFLFVRWLTKNVPVSLLAGFAFVLLPYHYQKASGHLAYVHTWVFVLILWAGLRVAQRPSIRRGFALGGAVALACYVDGYYLLIATIFGGTVAVLAVVAPHRDQVGVGERVKAILAAGIVLAAALVPVLFVLATRTNTISAAVERSSSDVVVYSARVSEYVLPARHHPLLPESIASWEDRHLHESNYSEQTLYLGALPMVGTLAAIGLAVRRRRAEPLAVHFRGVIVVAGGAAFFALVMSAPPKVAIGGAIVPMPSGMVSSVLAFWRVYARFFLPVAVCVLSLAAAALSVPLAALGRRRTIASCAAVAVIGPLVVLDYLPPRPPPTFSYARDTPAEYQWLDDRPPNQIIAEYPLDPPPLPNHITYLSYQRTHQQRLLNGAVAGTDTGYLERGLAGLADPQTVPALAQLGVRFVVIHPTTFGHAVDATTLPPSLTKVFTAPTGDVYRVAASGVDGPAALAPAEGFHDTDTTGFTSSRWMRTAATLDLHLFERSGPLLASFKAISFGTPRRLVIRQGGRVVWSGDVPADAARDITFSIDGGRGALDLRATPGAVPIERLLPDTHDGRPVTINVGGLGVTRG
ncbi:MAG TPA: hypothetical protein VM143_06275 [Acidimicrobiales bacterium]|nr:hypothetical protein [Acidimicrobiales bacterium]